MRSSLLFALAASSFILGAHAREIREVPALADCFKARGVVGTFVLLDAKSGAILAANAERAAQRFVPASTFKIPNSLIGLHVGAVKDIDEVLPYGGKPQRLKQWEKDMSLRDAIKVSNVPVYQELARRIGLARMRENVRRLAYGNAEIGEVVDQFWLRGPLRISALEQVEFLRRLATGDLPVGAKTIEAVKEITLLERTPDYALHAKTGWHSSEGNTETPIGWWVGWVERDGAVYPFALNIDLTNDADAPKRVTLGRECLRALGKL